MVPDKTLLEELQQVLRSDPELAVEGKFFTCSLLLATSEHRFLLRFRDGELVDLIPNPMPVDAWQFAIKAPDHTWERFLQDPPPPEFHDIWAATWLGHMMIEGDVKVLMQNHRALWRTLKLLREIANERTAA